MCQVTQNRQIPQLGESMPRPTKKRIQRLTKVVSILNQNQGGLWLREIARRSKLHVEDIRRLVEAYPMILESYADFTPYNINLKIIKLKNPNLTPKNLERYLHTIDI